MTEVINSHEDYNGIAKQKSFGRKDARASCRFLKDWMMSVFLLSVLGTIVGATSPSGPDSALRKAVLSSDVAGATAAIGAGANVNATFDAAARNRTVLMEACCGIINNDSACNAPMALLLMNHGAAANARDLDGDTALIQLAKSQALQGGTDTIAAALLSHGADIHARNHAGLDAFLASAANDNYDLFRLLVTHGFDINDQDKGGATALMLACWSGPGDGNRGQPSSKIALYLIDNGADVNRQSSSGRTALMWLAKDDPLFERDSIRIARDLIAHHALVTLRNHQGKTASQIASANHLSRLAGYLKSLGG